MKYINDSFVKSIVNKSRDLVKFFGSKIDRLLNAVSAFLYIALGIRALTHMDTAWDSLAYHLPFAARLSGIFPKSEYAYDSYFESLYMGVPKLTEFLQGLFWRSTGLVSAANLVGFISILLVVIVATTRLKLRFWMVTLFLFSIPLVSIHSITSYNDLPAGSFITIAFINLIAAFERDRFDIKNLFAVLIPLAVSANLKYQTTLIAVMFFALVFLIFMYKNINLHNPANGRKNFYVQFVVVSLFCGLLLCGNLLYNFIQYKNPFFPLAAKIGPVYFDGPLAVGLAGESQDTNVLRRYIYSLSELHLWTDNRGGLWTIDMSSSGNDEYGINFKTGGYFVVNLVLWSGFLLIGNWFVKDSKDLNYLIIALASFAVVALLPVPYYLRYWLFLPMNLALAALLLFEKHARHVMQSFALVLLLQFPIFIFVTHQLKTIIFPPSYELGYIRQSLIENYERDGQEDLDTPSPVCVVFEDTRQGFLYKLLNPDSVIQAVTTEEECTIDQILYYP